MRPAPGRRPYRRAAGCHEADAGVPRSWAPRRARAGPPHGPPLLEAGKARETIRKTLPVLAMLFDYAGITPNPARDRVRVKLPRGERPELSPPTAEHVDAVHRLLAPAYRLPLLVLDATGM